MEPQYKVMLSNGNVYDCQMYTISEHALNFTLAGENQQMAIDVINNSDILVFNSVTNDSRVVAAGYQIASMCHSSGNTNFAYIK